MRDSVTPCERRTVATGTCNSMAADAHAHTCTRRGLAERGRTPWELLSIVPKNNKSTKIATQVRPVKTGSPDRIFGERDQGPLVREGTPDRP